MSRCCWFLITLVITAFFSSLTYAHDPNPLQDICVAVNDSTASVFVNGKICKDPKLVEVDDFFASGLNVSGNIVPGYGFAAKIVNVNNMPGLNTLGISISRIDFEPQGFFPLHIHPRASTLITVMEGILHVGFLVPDTKNLFKSHLISKHLNPGDVFSIPQGLIHFLYNVGNKKTTTFISFNSQNPGFIVIPNSIFDSKPFIPDHILAKNFQLDQKDIAELRKKFS